MEPADYDIMIAQGRTFRLAFSWKDSNNANVAFTDATLVVFQIKDNYKSTSALITAKVGSGVTLSDTDPTITVVLTPAQTDQLSEGTCVYDLGVAVSGSTGDISPLLRGTAYVNPRTAAPGEYA